MVQADEVGVGRPLVLLIPVVGRGLAPFVLSRPPPSGLDGPAEPPQPRRVTSNERPYEIASLYDPINIVSVNEMLGLANYSVELEAYLQNSPNFTTMYITRLRNVTL